MDSSNTMAPGASSSHHVSQTNSLVTISHSGNNKKRGRPRKYKPDQSSNISFSPMPPPPSSSAPPATAKSYVEEKQPNLAAARQINSEKKQRNKIGAEKLDDWVDCVTGSSFLPHAITVNTGEDISTKIMEFSLQGPRSVSIVSGNGTVSRVKIRHPNSSGGSLTYEGLFEIISLSGSFIPVEKPNSKFGRAGMMKISLSGADGRVVGGLVDGPMIAATPVKVVVASFLVGSPSEVEPKKRKTEASVGIDESSAPCTNVERNCSTVPQNQNNNWGAPKTVERTTAADINISLHG